MGFTQRMQQRGFAALMVACGLLLSAVLLASAAVAVKAGDLWSSAGLPAGFFLLIGSLHMFERFLRRPTPLRFTRDSTGVRIPVNRDQLRFVLAVGVGLTLPGVWGLSIAVAVGAPWWPWLIPTVLFAPMILIAARSIGRRPTLVLNPNTIEFRRAVLGQRCCLGRRGEHRHHGHPAPGTAQHRRPAGGIELVDPKSQAHRAAKMGVNSRKLPAICVGDLWARDREMITVLCPLLDLYRRNPRLRSELLSEAFEHRINSQQAGSRTLSQPFE